MQPNLKILTFLLTLLNYLQSSAQGYRTTPVNKLWDAKSGLILLIFGGLVWAFGMLFLNLFKNKEVSTNKYFYNFGGVCCFIGAIFALFGLVLFGF